MHANLPIWNKTKSNSTLVPKTNIFTCVVNDEPGGRAQKIWSGDKIGLWIHQRASQCYMQQLIWYCRTRSVEQCLWLCSLLQDGSAFPCVKHLQKGVVWCSIGTRWKRCDICASECESVRVWECESVRVWECESVRVWEYKSVRVWVWE